MDNETLSPDTPATTFAAGLHAATPRQVTQPGQYAVVPEGAALHSLEGYLPAPSRIRTTIGFYEAASFCRYVLDFKDAWSRIFADQAGLSLCAYLDYHAASTGPRWGSHIATLGLRLTEAWKKWISANGKRMDQVTFASFLEDNLVDIAAPDGATLLEMAKNLEVKKAAAFTSAIRLDNGEHQFGYVEDIQGTGQKGTITIPGSFVLGIAPVEGVEPYRVDARLRYRMQDGKLAIWFDLLRPDDYLRDAFKSVVEFVKTQTQLDVLLGGVAKS